jgi:hypothetical protein
MNNKTESYNKNLGSKSMICPNYFSNRKPSVDESKITESVMHSKNIRNNGWRADESVFNCHKCGSVFGFFLRKHHCRCCGNIFCYKCSSNKQMIPEFIKDVPPENDYWNLSHYVPAISVQSTAVPKRVCDNCADQIIIRNSCIDKINDIFDKSYDITKVCAIVCDNKENIIEYYFEQLRNIQYYFPDHIYSDTDKKLLRTNSKYFRGHNKYIVHLIKSIDWKNNESFMDDLIVILTDDPIKTCVELKCTRTCGSRLTFDDCINILFTSSDTIPNLLLKYIFDIIKLTPEFIILSYTSFFINLIKTTSNDSLQEIIYPILSSTIKIIYRTCWFIMNIIDESNDFEKNKLESFLGRIDSEILRTISNEYRFYSELRSNMNNIKNFLALNFKISKPISLPYEPDIKLIDVCINSIETKDSYTKPIVIKFYTNKNTWIRILFKNDCVMNDVSVLNIMTLCNTILNENMCILKCKCDNNNNSDANNNIDCNSNYDNNTTECKCPSSKFDSVTYPIFPLTNNFGMIEMVENAKTIYDITLSKTITTHILHNNRDKLGGEILDKYLYSLVSYTLHSYLLGLGDRHLQNIMIRNDGSIFHIDFSFMLGDDTFPLSSSEIKLNSDILSILGEKGNYLHQEFLSLCADSIILLRKYYCMFFILLTQDTKYSQEKIKTFITQKFQPRETDDYMVQDLLTIIEKSNESYSSSVKDFIFYHNKQKTIINGLNNIVYSAYNFFSFS